MRLGFGYQAVVDRGVGDVAEGIQTGNVELLPGAGRYCSSQARYASNCTGLGATTGRAALRRSRASNGSAPPATSMHSARSALRPTPAWQWIEHSITPVEPFADPGNAFVDHLHRDGMTILGGKVQERDPVLLKQSLVVAVLHPEVDDCADPLAPCEMLDRPAGPGAAHGELIVDPVEVEVRRRIHRAPSR